MTNNHPQQLPLNSMVSSLPGDEMGVIKPGEILKILLIDPDTSMARFSRINLEKTGNISIQEANNGREALSHATNSSFDAVVSDYDMPDMNGMDLHRILREGGIKIPFILFTAPEREQESGMGDDTALMYPEAILSPDPVYIDLSQKIRQAVELFRTKNRLELYSKHLEDLVEERTRQLKEIQRFAVIGELSTMIGHDMRNPLQVITNMNYLLTRKIALMNPEDAAVLQKHGIPDLFTRINTETQYLNKIVSDLQNYAREVNLNTEPIDPGRFLDELLGSIALPESIRIVKKYQPGIVVAVDPILFRRVMENLIINAIQAMDQGGVLTLTTGREHDLISLTVSDTGTGIPSEAQDRIFEPLFTTKSKGTGFGLPVCKRLVEAHGGMISLKETSPGGTSFEVSLPAQQTTAPDEM